MTASIAVAIQQAQQKFQGVSETAKLDAELLLAHSLGKPRSYLYSWPDKTLSAAESEQFQTLVELRLKPTPVAYLLVEREFYSLTLKISPVALIPRPETELLVETALEYCADIQHPKILEMGTGTGAISIALLHERPDIELTTTDISPECLELAQANANLNGVSLNCIESDWFQNLDKNTRFDLIVSNPPYIAADDPYLQQGDLPAEPLLALTPGKSGLEAIQQIVSGATERLCPGGYLMLEHGFDQAESVAGLLRQAGFTDIQNLRDYSDHPRVSLGQCPQQ